MKIAITGATGFVGAHLVRHFSAQGMKVIALGRQANPPKALKKFASWEQVDISKEFPNIEADILVHAAGLASDKGSYHEFYESNTRGTQKIFEAFSGEHFIYISSASVYPTSGKILNESDTADFDTLSNYGKSKILAEQYLKENADSKKRVTALRPRAIYGTNDRVLLPKILGLFKNHKIVVPGKMNIEISMTHISNLIQAVEKTKENQSKHFEIYNVVDGQTYMLRKVVKTLIDTMFKTDAPVKELPLGLVSFLCNITDTCRIPFPITKQSLDYISKPCILDYSKIREDLGYKPNTDFYQELGRLHCWVRKQGISNVLAAKKTLPWEGLCSSACKVFAHSNLFHQLSFNTLSTENISPIFGEL